MMPISVLPEELQELVHTGSAEGKDISFTNK